MIWTDIAPVFVAVGGVITAFAAWLKIRHGEGNKRIDAEMKTKELMLRADEQDNNQIMGLVTFQQTMLDKHQSRLDALQTALEAKAENEAEHRAELRLMRYRITECEEDRMQLRARVIKLEQSVNNPSKRQEADTDQQQP